MRAPDHTWFQSFLLLLILFYSVKIKYKDYNHFHGVVYLGCFYVNDDQTGNETRMKRQDKVSGTLGAAGSYCRFWQDCCGFSRMNNNEIDKTIKFRVTGSTVLFCAHSCE